MKKKKFFTTYRVVFVGVMSALIAAVTFFRFPLLGSKVHFANTLCLLSGFLFGPFFGGLSAGIGSTLYDALFGGYDFLQCMITLGSKFVMGFLAGLISHAHGRKGASHGANVIGGIVGALAYVVLYMLKTYLYQRLAYGLDPSGSFVVLMGKLPASLINAGLAIVAAPVLAASIRPALKRAGVLEKF